MPIVIHREKQVGGGVQILAESDASGIEYLRGRIGELGWKPSDAVRIDRTPRYSICVMGCRSGDIAKAFANDDEIQVVC